MSKHYNELAPHDPWRRNKYYNPDGESIPTCGVIVHPKNEDTAPNAEFRTEKIKKPRSTGKVSVRDIAIALVKSGITTTEQLRAEIVKQRPDANHGTVRKAIADALRSAASK